MMVMKLKYLGIIGLASLVLACSQDVRDIKSMQLTGEQKELLQKKLTQEELRYVKQYNTLKQLMNLRDMTPEEIAQHSKEELKKIAFLKADHSYNEMIDFVKLILKENAEKRNN